jgi:hypothetical protein
VSLALRREGDLLRGGYYDRLSSAPLPEFAANHSWQDRLTEQTELLAACLRQPAANSFSETSVRTT